MKDLTFLLFSINAGKLFIMQLQASLLSRLKCGF
jgi:hypothetical protein